MAESMPPAGNDADTSPATGQSPAARSRLGRLVGLGLVITSVVLATYLLVAYFAYQSGRSLRGQQEATALAEQVGRQIELAQQDLAGDSPHMALTRLDWVLAQDPGNADALALRQQAAAADSAGRAVIGDSLPTVEPRSTATPVAEATAEVISDDERAAELQTARRLAAAERWEEALPLLVAFQQRFPDYERQETDRLLYDTYIALGLNYVNTDKVELGLNYFSQAERLGDLPQEARDYRVWADLYFQGMAYSGVNWDVAAGYWRDLCAAAPFYRDSCAWLNRSLIGLGDQYAFNLDWCPAIDIYQRAWNQQPTESLENKLAQAREGCAAATAVPLTNTVPITGTEPLTPTDAGG